MTKEEKIYIYIFIYVEREKEREDKRVWGRGRKRRAGQVGSGLWEGGRVGLKVKKGRKKLKQNQKEKYLYSTRPQHQSKSSDERTAVKS